MDARAVRSRDALRRAFLNLLKQRPLDQITIREIAGRAGVGYTTYFRHYPTKEMLLDDLATEQIDRLFELTMPVLERENTLAACTALCSYVEENRTLWSILLTGGAAGAMREEFLRLCRKVAAYRAPPDSWLPAELGVILGVSATVELLDWWLRQSDPLPVDQIAEILDRIVISPTVNKDPRRRTTAQRPSKINPCGVTPNLKKVGRRGRRSE